MNKTLLEVQDRVLYFTTLALSEISMLSSSALQSVQDTQTLQGFLSPLYYYSFRSTSHPNLKYKYDYRYSNTYTTTPLEALHYIQVFCSSLSVLLIPDCLDIIPESHPINPNIQ